MFAKTGPTTPEDLAKLRKQFPDEAFSSVTVKQDYRHLAREFNARLDKDDEVAKILAELASPPESLTEQRTAQLRKKHFEMSTKVMVRLLADFGLDKDDPVSHAVRIQQEATKLLK